MQQESPGPKQICQFTLIQRLIAPKEKQGEGEEKEAARKNKEKKQKAV
jgi:hypothetical protein